MGITTDEISQDTKKGDCDREDGEDKITALALPPDGGWGWVIVGASLVCNVILDGVCFSFGIFIVEFLNYFQGSKSKTAIVGSLVPGMYQGIGPIASALANMYGFRPVTIVGGVIAASAFFLSTFSPNLNWLIFTCGVMGGFGFGLMYLPSIVIVSFYFTKKRALATGIAVCGSGIGMFIFPKLASALLTEFGWRGTYWIISAIILHTIACGLVFRQLQTKSIATRASRRRSPSVVKTEGGDGGERKAMMKTNGFAGTSIDNNSLLLPSAHNNPITTIQLPKTTIQSIRIHNILSSSLVNVNTKTPTPLETSRRSVGSEPNLAYPTRDELEAARPMNRADIFLAASITHLPEYDPCQSEADFVGSVMKIPQNFPADDGTWRSKFFPVINAMRDMFDLSIVKCITFDVLCFASVLAMLGMFIPFVFLIDYAVHLKIDLGTASNLLTVLGVFNTISRIISGWISDMPWANCIIINNGALILAGVSTCLIPVLTNFPLLVVYCAVFGTCIAAWVTLRSIVLVELLGLEKLTNAFGISLLVQGLAALIGAPLAGAMYDATQSYTTSFILSGCLFGSAGLILLPIRKIASWEKRREKDFKESIQYKMVNNNNDSCYSDKTITTNVTS